MDNDVIIKHFSEIYSQLVLLNAQVNALQEIFFAYLSAEHNDLIPKFSEGVKAEYADVFGDKVYEFLEKLPSHDPIAQNVREKIILQLEILKSDLDNLEDFLNRE